MSWTRRAFLTLSAGALTAGCASRIAGRPVGVPGATSSSAPPPAAAVTVGLLAFQPYTIEQNDEVTGPLPEVARTVLSKIGVTEVRFQTQPEETILVAGITAGHYDMVAGLSVRADLCSGLQFTVPDLVSGTALIVPKGNPKKLTTYADVVAAKARLAAMTNLPEVQDALTAGVPQASLVQLPVPQDLVEAVRNGQVDAAAFDSISAQDMAKVVGDGAVETAPPFLPPGRPPLTFAYGFPKDQPGVYDPFNEALQDLHDSGEWLDIVSEFGLTEANAPSPDLTVDQICAG